MATYSSPDEEITGSEDIIRLPDVNERVKKIENARCEGGWAEGCENVGLCPSCYGEAEEELAALEGLLEDFRDGSAEPENSFAVNENYMTGYAIEQGDSLADVGQGSFLFSYVKWEELGEDLKNDMFNTEYRGSRYYIRG